MNASEILKNIKALFSEIPAPIAEPVAPAAPAPVEFKDYNLMDGTVVSIDKLEVGGMVMNGIEMVADAEYYLADGSSIVVVGGYITEVKPMEVVEPIVPEELAAPTVQTVQLADQRVDGLIAENKKLKESFMQLLSVVEGLVELPAIEPINAAKTIFSEAQKSRNERFKEIQNTIQKLKK